MKLVTREEEERTEEEEALRRPEVEACGLAGDVLSVVEDVVEGEALDVGVGRGEDGVVARRGGRDEAAGEGEGVGEEGEGGHGV